MKIEVSNGELIDKLTILEIKLDKIENESQLENLTREWEIINDGAMTLYQIYGGPALYKNIDKLEDINRQLWDIEDWIRDCEKEQRFDKEFVELARSVYKLNDKRAEIKRNINLVTKSNLIEEKSYSK